MSCESHMDSWPGFALLLTIQTAVFAAGRDVRDKGLKPEKVNLSHRFTIAFMSLAGVAEVGVISKHSEAIDHAG